MAGMVLLILLSPFAVLSVSIPKQIISDDNYVANNCRAYGVTMRSSQYLLQENKASSIRDLEKLIDSKTATEITDMLRNEYGL
jgi:hypothetical protein